MVGGTRSVVCGRWLVGGFVLRPDFEAGYGPESSNYISFKKVQRDPAFKKVYFKVKETLKFLKKSYFKTKC